MSNSELPSNEECRSYLKRLADERGNDTLDKTLVHMGYPTRINLSDSACGEAVAALLLRDQERASNVAGRG